MFLELSEVLVCPRCRPAQGLVVLADELEDRRLVEGHLGCPECERRFPVRHGVVRFDEPTGDEGEEAAGGDSRSTGGGPAGEAPGRRGGHPRPPEGSEGWPEGADDETMATRVAALLGVTGGEGYLLLGPRLSDLAGAVSRRTGGAEVLALARGAGPAGPEEGVSPFRGVAPAALPVVSGRLRGVALLAPGREEIREGGRLLAAGGRLAVFRPSSSAEEAVREEDLEVLAADERALVAGRPA